MRDQQQVSSEQRDTDQPSAQPSPEDKGAQLLNTEGFVIRLAQELRAKGDPDLPLTFYAQQAKQLLLTGRHPKDVVGNIEVPRAVNDQVYQSWALSKR